MAKASKTSSFLSKTLKSMNNPLQVIATQALKTDISGYIDTGCYTLNAAFSGSIFGGLPMCRINAFAGSESVGKTFLACSIASSFLKLNPDALVFIYDSEAAYNEDIMKKWFGDNRDRVIHAPVATIEQFSFQLNHNLDDLLSEPENERPPVLFILDSQGNLTNNAELETVKTDSPKADMGRAQKLLKATFRTITLRMAQVKATGIVIGHTYGQMGVMYPTDILAGGSGLKYAASNIGFLYKSKEKDSSGEQTGTAIRCRMAKSRCTKENVTQAEFVLDFNTGLSRFSGLAELAVELGVLQQDGKKVVLPDGRKKFISRITDEDFNKELLEKIDAATIAAFKLGSPSGKPVAEVDEEEEDDSKE